MLQWFGKITHPVSCSLQHRLTVNMAAHAWWNIPFGRLECQLEVSVQSFFGGKGEVGEQGLYEGEMCVRSSVTE